MLTVGGNVDVVAVGDNYEVLTEGVKYEMLSVGLYGKRWRGTTTYVMYRW